MSYKKDIEDYTTKAFKDISSSLCIFSYMLDFGPLKEFRCLADVIENGNSDEAIKQYHRLTKMLIESPSRKNSGNLWKDYILFELLESDNIFSRSALIAQNDGALEDAMMRDMDFLSQMCLFDDDVIDYWFSRFNDDDYEIPDLQSLDYYESNRFLTDYATDSVFNDTYIAFMNNESWGDNIKLLRALYDKCGSGKFIRHRIFSYGEDGIEPLRLGRVSADYMYDDENARLYELANSFIKDGEIENVLLLGDDAFAKSRQIALIANEIKDARVVVFDGKYLGNIIDVIDEISVQPYKFIIYIDNADLSDNMFRTLESTLAFMDEFEKNFVIYAAGSQKYYGRLFTQKIVFDK